MGKARNACAAIMVFLVTEGAARVQVYVPSGSPRHGALVFAEKGCLRCHSIRGTGGTAGPDLARSAVHAGVLEIAARMWSHAPAMRKARERMGGDAEPMPELLPDDVKDVLAYLLFVGLVPESGDPVEGRSIFAAKGCEKCHRQGKAPGAGIEAPVPTKMAPSLSGLDVAQAMWNHARTMASEEPSWAPFKLDETRHLIAYLRGPLATTQLPADTSELPGTPLAGEIVFESKGCASCHLPGRGGQPMGPDLGNARWYKTAAELAAVLWNHGPMLAKTSRTPGGELRPFVGTDMADTLAYLYVLKSGEAVGEPTRGAEVFSTKRCAVCHAGSGPGADLTKGSRFESPAQLGSAMWNHAAKMEDAIAAKGLAWPELTGRDVGDLLAFLVAPR